MRNVSSPVAEPGGRTKQHYFVLDGLRGVAAFVVVFYHLFQAYADGDRFRQIINHGYLAVDFFFLLSGFVVAYAYDDRWIRMSQVEFYKRRLIRLQPMVVMGMSIGAASLYFQAGHKFAYIALVPVWKVVLAMFLGCLMLPLPGNFMIHGYAEMYPLDGAAWSLFYEYFANILYAAWLRRLSAGILSLLTLCSAALLAHLAIFGGRGDISGGWSLEPSQMRFGFARVLFPFLAGILLMRSGARLRVKGAFWICGALLVALLATPRVGGQEHLRWNGMYEAFCVIVLFPIIVAMGAGEQTTGGHTIRVSRFFGELSYPLYITHFALIEIYSAWVFEHRVPPGRGALVGVFVLLISTGFAYLCLKLYDEPVRMWLSRRLLRRAG